MQCAVFSLDGRTAGADTIFKKIVNRSGFLSPYLQNTRRTEDALWLRVDRGAFDWKTAEMPAVCVVLHT